MAFVKLEKLIYLHDGYQQAFNINGLQLLLIQENNETHIFENSCPHRGMPLTKATVESDILRCPVHGIEFSLSTGFATNSAEACKPLKRIIPSYEGDCVGVYDD